MQYVKNEVLIKALGKQIIKLRKERKITQEELCHLTGLVLTQVGRIERGEINTTASTLYVIATALKVHPRELWDFDMPTS